MADAPIDAATGGTRRLVAAVPAWVSRRRQWLDGRVPGRLSRRPVWLAAVVAVVVVLSVVGVAAASGSGSSDYRTASVVRGTVQSTVDSTGTIAPINQASLGFPVSGTVSAVPVAIGQHVTVGQLLAQLDTTSLDAQVASAQASIASAQNRLASDEAGQTSGSAAAATPAMYSPTATLQVTDAVYTPGTATVARASAPTAAAGSGGSGSISDLQAQLVADQHRTDLALSEEQAELNGETAACKSFLTGGKVTIVPSVYQHGGSSSTGSSTPSAAASADPAPAPAASGPAASGPAASGPAASGPAASGGSGKTGTAKPAPAPATPDASGCQDAISKLLAQQITVSQDQQSVATDEAALNAAIAKLVPSGGAEGAPQQPPATGGGRPTGTQPGAGSPGTARSGTGAEGQGGSGAGSAAKSGAGGTAKSGGSGGAARSGGGGSPASAEQLAADQAAIDAANASLAVAQQSVDQAKLVSPIDGTVAAVTVAAGQSVAASSGSSTPQIVVIGPGANEITTTISDTNVGSVRVGSKATVTPSGSNTQMDGKVVAVGLLSSSTGGSVSYPVTIGLSGATPQLADGQGATVSIVTAQVSDAVAVPSSAVHTLGAIHTVTVLKDGTPTSTRVEIGAVGATLTQVTSGLNTGDEVMLADLTQPLPTATTGGLRGIGGGGGRPGG